MCRPFTAICIALFSTIAFAGNDSNIKLFVSASMGQQLLNELIKQVEHEVLVVRGVNSHQQNLLVAFQQWQQMLRANAPSASVEIDPIAFRQNQVDRVPAMSLTVNGKTELVAFGSTSTDWLKRQYQAGKRGNLGTFGTTYPVVEPDLLEVLFKRLQQINWQTVQTQANKRLQDKNFSYGAKLPTSQQASSKVLSIPGNWHTPLIALDINDRQQQKAVASVATAISRCAGAGFKQFITAASRLSFTLASTFDLYHATRTDSSLSIDLSTCITHA